MTGTAREELLRAVSELDERHEPVPCRGRHEWTSDWLNDRIVAARLCRPCAALALCRAAADESREQSFVWAGADRSPRPYTRRQETPA